MEELHNKDLSDPKIAEEKEETTKTKFQVYCDENPDALECRIYED